MNRYKLLITIVIIIIDLLTFLILKSGRQWTHPFHHGSNRVSFHTPMKTSFFEDSFPESWSDLEVPLDIKITFGLTTGTIIRYYLWILAVQLLTTGTHWHDAITTACVCWINEKKIKKNHKLHIWDSKEITEKGVFRSSKRPFTRLSRSPIDCKEFMSYGSAYFDMNFWCYYFVWLLLYIVILWIINVIMD